MHPRFIERASFGATIAVLNCCPMRRSIRFSRPGMKRACDQEELQRCFRLQIEAGVDGLIVYGSLGEASTLDLGEKLETLHLARSVAARYSSPSVTARLAMYRKRRSGLPALTPYKSDPREAIDEGTWRPDWDNPNWQKPRLNPNPYEPRDLFERSCEHVTYTVIQLTKRLVAAVRQRVLSGETPTSSLKRWAMQVARRRGLKRAKVACARKLAIILHRMWIDETDFRWVKEATAAA